MQQSLFDYMVKERPQNINLRREEFVEFVQAAGLSVRATNVLKANVLNMQEFLNLTEERLSAFRNCGKKTISEILEFQREVREQTSYVTQKKAEQQKKKDVVSPKRLRQYSYVFDEVTSLLTERARKVLANYYIDSLERFMNLSVKTMKQMKNCGKTTIVEYRQYQSYTYQLFEKIEKLTFEEGIPECDLKPIVVYELFDDILLQETEVLDPQMPFFSLKKWIASLNAKSQKEQRAFMLRLGMLGNAPLTFEEIGQQLGGLTRERVRQIIEKMENIASHRLHQKKLTPIIQKIATIVQERGGKVKNTTLISLLLVHGENGENLKYATGFLDFLSSFSAWRELGLQIDEEGVVSINACSDLLKPLSLVVRDLAKTHADQVISDELWSIDFQSLRTLATDWIHLHYPERNFRAISEVILEEAITLVPEIKRSEDRVYSYDLWTLSCDTIMNSIEIILKTAKRAMHFTEAHAELQRYRPGIKERNVYAKLERHRKLFLWGRGTYIHKSYVSIPYTLVADIEKWVLEQLRKEVPFISVYGAFTCFEQQCLQANIPNENALYSLLRELAHPLLAYPKLPYIYPNHSKLKRISSLTAVENFFQDAGEPVSADELREFVLEKLYLKDFQFEQIKSELSNVIKIDEEHFLHIDCLDVDHKKFRGIVEYIQNLLRKEDHISVARVFADKRISCKMLGIDGPVGLFSLLQLFTDDEFDLKRYPQIRLLSSNNNHKDRRVPDEVADYIKKKGQPCSYQELQERFIDKLGYKYQTVFSVRYKNTILNYLRDCLIHIDTIGWSEASQDALEEIAYRHYAENVKIGKPYGLLTSMIESDNLLSLDKDLYWTPYLLADILVRRERFKILGNRKNAFVPIPNQLEIETLEDLVYELLKNDFGGGTNLIDFTQYLRDCDIIVKNLTDSMLGDSQKVKIVGKEIIMKELLENA